LTTIIAAAGPHVSLTADTLFSIAGFPITNTMVLGLFGYALLIGILLYTARSVAHKKTNRLTALLQWGFETLYSSTRDIIGNDAIARSLTPLVVTMFFAVLINNWLGIVPGVGSLTYGEAPALRGLAADLNFTFALATITVIAVQAYAVKELGFFHNLSRYFVSPKGGVIAMFEGILELVGEFSRFVALSMRLFGNVFGGEVLLTVVSYLSGWFAFLPLPLFMLMELFVGALQAYVFYMLTVIFVSLAISHTSESAEHAAVDPYPVK
jgi:F-type H+-transporting ATPase subunit a